MQRVIDRHEYQNRDLKKHEERVNAGQMETNSLFGSVFSTLNVVFLFVTERAHFLHFFLYSIL